MVKLEQDVVLVLAGASSLANLESHGTRHHVAARQVLGRGGVPLHETFAFAVDEVAALSAHALRDEDTGAIDPGRVKLDKLHVLQRQSGAQHHAVAIARTGVGRGTRQIAAAVSAGRENGQRRGKPVKGAVFQAPGHHAPAGAVIVHDEIEGEVLDEELRLVAQGLLVERVQDGMAGAVGSGTGSLGGALAVLRGHATEGALVDGAFGGA